MTRTYSFRLASCAAAAATLSGPLGGCTTTAPVQGSVCQVVAPDSLDQLAESARAELTKPACRGEFPVYFELALKRAEASPDERNRTRFADFLKASADQGLISQPQARELYTRYFHTTFVSLPADYNICSTLRSKEQLFSSLEIELADKRRGMLAITGDRAGYQDAQRQYNDLELVLEATAFACTDT